MQISTPLNGKVLAHHFNFLKEDCFCPICTSAAILGFSYNVIHIEKKILKVSDILKSDIKVLRGNLIKEKYFELCGAGVNVVGLSTYFILSAFCICLTEVKRLLSFLL